MNITVWVLQGLLALAFLAAGAMKLIKSREELQPTMGYVEDYSDAAIKGIGATEVAAALGLVLPAALGIATFLTPLAAVGLAVTMIVAAVVHLRRDEPIVTNVVLGGLALFVAVMRFGPEAF